MRKKGIRALLSAPLIVNDEQIGMIVIRFAEHRPLPSEDIDLVEALANQATVAVQLTQLSTVVRAAAVVEERNRLAREIHDTLAQALAAIIRQLEAHTKSFAERIRPIDDHVSLAITIARESLVEARRSIRALRPLALDRGTLADALRAAVSRATSMTPAEVTFALVGTPWNVPTDVEDELLRVANEALINAVKHSGAETIALELHYEPASVKVSVSDGGAGFDPANSARGGVGLSSIRERAARIGASVTLATELGGGTELIAYWEAPASGERST